MDKTNGQSVPHSSVLRGALSLSLSLHWRGCCLCVFRPFLPRCVALSCFRRFDFVLIPGYDLLLLTNNMSCGWCSRPLTGGCCVRSCPLSSRAAGGTAVSHGRCSPPFAGR